MENSPVAPPHGGAVGPEVGESIMDFTKLKETLPQFSEFPKPSSDPAEQTLHEIDDALKSPVNHVDIGDIIGSTEARVSQEGIQPIHSIPIMETAQVDGICLTQSQNQPSMDKETEKVQSRKILKDIVTYSPKTRLKHTRKKKMWGMVTLSQVARKISKVVRS